MRLRISTLTIIATIFLSSLLLLPRALSQETITDAARCEHLAQLALPSVKVRVAQVVLTGMFTPPSTQVSPAEHEVYAKLPGFCRISAELTPSPDSNIVIEVWMPLVAWNHKLEAVGNGGFAGSIFYAQMAQDLGDGYATVGTNTGHSGSDASWALGHPEKVIDFGYRAIHEMTVEAKVFITKYYGSGPEHAYFVSCSDGGREALMEAQRFPEDYGGIIAGDPANDWTHLYAGAMWQQVQALKSGRYIPPSKLPPINERVLAACDRQDGVVDGILTDPRTCHFDPEVLLCKGMDSHRCLTTPQIVTLKNFYTGAPLSNGKQVSPGYMPGDEEGAAGWYFATVPGPGKSIMFALAADYFSKMVYEDAEWDYHSFNLNKALQLANRKTGAALNAIDPDLRAFEARGGKLIIFHGWNDPAIPALMSVDYYNNVVSAMGQKDVDSFLRLYMVPGMQHCGNGPGPDFFGQSLNPLVPEDPEHNMLLALGAWVERGAAPAAIIATKFAGAQSAQTITMTRPLCPYPQVAVYRGVGNTNDAANFSCRPYSHNPSAVLTKYRPLGVKFQ